MRSLRCPRTAVLALLMAALLLLAAPAAQAGPINWMQQKLAVSRDQRRAGYAFRAGVSQERESAFRAGILKTPPTGPKTVHATYKNSSLPGLRWIGNALLRRDGRKYHVEVQTVARGGALSAQSYDLYATGSKQNLAAYFDHLEQRFGGDKASAKSGTPSAVPHAARETARGSRKSDRAARPASHEPRLAVVSDGNLPRRSENQDHFGMAMNKRGAKLLLVADGAGGERGGRQAAHLGIRAITTSFRATAGKRPYDKVLRRMFWRANRVLNHSRKKGQEVGYSTVTGAIVTPRGELYVGNLGDSPAYLFSTEQGRTTQLSRNQNGAAENVITDYLGKEQGKPENQVHIAPRAKLRAGDRVLLCSDGLDKFVPQATIGQLLGQRGRDVNDIARDLVAAAKRGGSDDNITVHIYEHR